MTRPARRFVSLLIRVAPRMVLVSIVLMILTAATEGVGILLLVPLLGLAGVATGTAPTGDGWLMASRFLPDSLGPLLAIYVVVVAARAALELAESVASLRVDTEVTRLLRERVYRALVRARWEAVVPIRGSRLAHVLTEEMDRVSIAVNQLLRGTLDFLIALTYAATALAVSPMLALVAASGALLLLAGTWRQQHGARRDGEVLSSLGADLFAGATEQVATLKVAKSAGIAERVAQRFSERAAAYASAMLRTHRHYVGASAGLTAGAAAWLAVVVYTAVELMHLAPATLLLLLFVCARLIPRLASVQSSLLMAARSIPSAERVLDLIDELETAAETELDGPATEPLIGDLHLESVSYAYPGSSSPALHDVSLDVPAGMVTALVGGSGAGKSTLADVILLLLTPQTGSLRVGDVALGNGTRAAWRACVGYVPQETQLFHDTVRENVRWVAPAASDEAVLHALELAGATALVGRLPQSLDTVIGDRGTLLSGGERQRIALARALLRRPRLLVLDEATSALDPESERAIRRTLAALTPSVTVLTITHRLTSARHADHVVVLENGSVVAAGPWDELINQPDSRLAALWASQLELDQPLVSKEAAGSS